MTIFTKKINFMRIDIITVLPDILESPFNHSIIQRAKDKGLAEIHIHNLRDFSEDKHHRVDDYSFGKGAGMVMAIQPIEKAINFLKSQRNYDEIIFTTPDGHLFDQKEANNLSMLKNIIILCGHYKGIDQRIRETMITMEISIGDYVLTGGELAAAVISDSIIRLLPGVLSDETSALTDSFQDHLLSPPVYTRPAEYKGIHVPEILRSGNDKLVDEWKHQQSIERTKKRRPDLYKKYMNGH
jgi:tRNA (guanine37-N1)-methyltransferase